MSDEFPINREVRQGGPLSHKLFTAVMEEVFKKADISEGTNANRENLTNLLLLKTNGKTLKQSELRKILKLV